MCACVCRASRRQVPILVRVHSFGRGRAGVERPVAMADEPSDLAGLLGEDVRLEREDEGDGQNQKSTKRAVVVATVVVATRVQQTATDKRVEMEVVPAVLAVIAASNVAAAMTMTPVAVAEMVVEEVTEAVGAVRRKSAVTMMSLAAVGVEDATGPGAAHGLQGSDGDHEVVLVNVAAAGAADVAPREATHARAHALRCSDAEAEAAAEEAEAAEAEVGPGLEAELSASARMAGGATTAHRHHAGAPATTKKLTQAVEGTADLLMPMILGTSSGEAAKWKAAAARGCVVPRRGSEAAKTMSAAAERARR